MVELTKRSGGFSLLYCLRISAEYVNDPVAVEASRNCARVEVWRKLSNVHHRHPTPAHGPGDMKKLTCRQTTRLRRGGTGCATGIKSVVIQGHVHHISVRPDRVKGVLDCRVNTAIDDFSHGNHPDAELSRSLDQRRGIAKPPRTEYHHVLCLYPWNLYDARNW